MSAILRQRARACALFGVSAYCQKCGSRIRLPASFCDNCGVSLDKRRPRYVEFGPAVHATGSQPNTVFDMFDRYAVVRPIGAGGMGMVVEVMDPWSGQRFALKVLNAALRLRSNAISALEREAQTQAALVHPNIVRVYSIVVGVEHRLGVLMELVEGASLDSVLHDRTGRPFSQGQLLWLMREMTTGLEVVHRHGYVHADVKPGNYIYGTTNRGPVLKITDFGIARSLRDEVEHSDTSRRSGTPGFMSPEQWRGHKLTPASDVYSLGCVFYEIATGLPPFITTDINEIEAAHINSTPCAVSSLRSGVQHDLEALIMSMLDKKPAARPASALDVLRRLPN